MTPSQLAQLEIELSLPAYAGKTAAEKLAMLKTEVDDHYFAVLIPPADVMTVVRGFASRINAIADSETRSKLQFKWGQNAATIRSLSQGVDVHTIPPGASANPVVEELQSGVSEGVILQAEINLLQAIGRRKARREEQLWGEGASVTLNDVALVS